MSGDRSGCSEEHGRSKKRCSASSTAVCKPGCYSARPHVLFLDCGRDRRQHLAPGGCDAGCTFFSACAYHESCSKWFVQKTAAGCRSARGLSATLARRLNKDFGTPRCVRRLLSATVFLATLPTAGRFICSDGAVAIPSIEQALVELWISPWARFLAVAIWPVSTLAGPHASAGGPRATLPKRVPNITPDKILLEAGKLLRQKNPQRLSTSMKRHTPVGCQTPRVSET